MVNPLDNPSETWASDDGQAHGSAVGHLDHLFERLEADSWKQAERHVEEAGFWGNFSWITGGASAVLAAAASGTAFTDLPVIAGILALLAAGTGALATALRPGELAGQHMKSAAAYQELQQVVWRIREFGPTDSVEGRDQIDGLIGRWTAATASSPRISQRLARKAQKRCEKDGWSYYPRPFHGLG